MFGCILLPAAIATLAWNEKNNVCQNNVFMSAETEAVVAECGDAQKYEGKFTFFSCPLDTANMTTMTPLSTFNMPGLQELVTFDTIAGSQNIEMYQCIESATKETADDAAAGGADEADATSLLDEDKANARKIVRQDHAHTHKHKTTSQDLHTGVAESVADSAQGKQTAYKYRMGWASSWYDSATFKASPENIQKSGCEDFVYNGRVNHNPEVPDRGDGKPVELGRQTSVATHVKAGGFTYADEEGLKALTAEEDVPMTKFRAAFALPSDTDNIVTAIDKNTVTVHDSSPSYLSTCQTDRLGCIRISYKKSEAEYLSVIGMAGASGVMEPWNVEAQLAKYPLQASYGCDATPFIRMFPKEMTKSEMIAELKGDNMLKIWAWRIACFIGAWFGMYFLLEPFANYADRMAVWLDVVPICGVAFGRALEGIVEMFVCLISCALGLGCGMMAAGLVWLGLRPIIGGPLLGGGVLMCIIGYSAFWGAWRDERKFHYGPKAKQLGFTAPHHFGENQGQPMMQEYSAQPMAQDNSEPMKGKGGPKGKDVMLGMS